MLLRVTPDPLYHGENLKVSTDDCVLEFVFLFLFKRFSLYMNRSVAGKYLMSPEMSKNVRFVV